MLTNCWGLTIVPEVGFRNVIHGTSVVRTHGHPTAVNRKERLLKPPLGGYTVAAGGVDAGSRQVCAEANPEKKKRRHKKTRVSLNRIWLVPQKRYLPILTEISGFVRYGAITGILVNAPEIGYRIPSTLIDPPTGVVN